MPTTCHCAGGQSPKSRANTRKFHRPANTRLGLRAVLSSACDRTSRNRYDTSHDQCFRGTDTPALLLTGGALASLFAVARLSGGPTAALAQETAPATEPLRPRTCSSLPKTWRRRTSNVPRSRCPSRSMRSRQSSIATFGFETNRRSGSRSASGWRSTFCRADGSTRLRSTSVSSKTVRRAAHRR